jgi:hypothetical protein
MKAAEGFQETGPQPCPFCRNGVYAAQTGPDGRATGGMVTHTLPPCEMWLVLEPVDFLVAARKARGIELPD